ncbi:glycosyltransferase family 62 protein [[Candida] arabinofermentans NRRL YB-2248]|uniref:Glycosyltransferase family 62 protein n=1 Tax=[Candida] arabinofermentans NRRL YB-2248 TaxID=983967 RepID=A0A1E4SY79_9ASCO|nr:glycosyltransferase family 62 protein [[Candida] arabinofermentans NRRL YB-2248]
MLRFSQHQKPSANLPLSHDFKPKKTRTSRKQKIGICVIVSIFLLLLWTRSGTSSKYDDDDDYSNIDNLVKDGSGSIKYDSDTELTDHDIDTISEASNEQYNLEIYDLNNYQGTPFAKDNEEIVLLCIPLRNAEKVLPLMFRNMMNMTYDHKLIDIAFLVSDCSEDDKTLETLFKYSEAMQEGKLLQLLDQEEKKSKDSGISGSSDLYLQYMPKDYIDNVKNAYSPPYHEEYNKPFRSVQVYQKDFGQAIGQGFSDRHDVKVQGIRRKLMGRARNWLMYTALKPYHSWVYWRDVDIETSPGDILQNLMKFSNGFDVIVPNVWRPLPTFLGNEQPYDLNSWIESEQGLELAKSLDEDDVIVEGYAEYPTWRVHLAYIRNPNGNENEIVDLDGVGGVSILARAKVFREGSNFPAFTFMNHAETEAFGKLTKKLGFKVGGLPHYTIWHIYEPSEDDLLQISTMERKKRRMRDRKGG